VPLDDIAVDRRGVAAFELTGHVVHLLDQGQVMGRFDRDRDTVLAQIVGIVLAAAALRVLVEDRRPRTRRLCRGLRCEKQEGLDEQQALFSLLVEVVILMIGAAAYRLPRSSLWSLD
jgi:hypothetical protein